MLGDGRGIRVGVVFVAAAGGAGVNIRTESGR